MKELVELFFLAQSGLFGIADNRHQAGENAQTRQVAAVLRHAAFDRLTECQRLRELRLSRKNNFGDARGEVVSSYRAAAHPDRRQCVYPGRRDMPARVVAG